MDFSWVDWLSLVIIGLYVWQGYERSIVIILADASSWMLGFYCMWKWNFGFMRWMVMNLGFDTASARFLAPLIIYIGVGLVTFKVLTWLSGWLGNQYVRRSWLRMISIIPSAVSGAGLVSLLLVALLAFPREYPWRVDLTASMIGKHLIKYIH